MPHSRKDNLYGRDLSDYVVHFTSDSADATAYHSMLNILGSGRVEARNVFGSAQNVSEVRDQQMSACFSEIPLDMLGRLAERRSRYGIAFTKSFVTEQGAGRVWYIDQGTPQDTALREMSRIAMTGGVNVDDEIWRITPFLDHSSPNYHFEWEREWRCPGGLSFTPNSVSFLFVPMELHDTAGKFLRSGGDGNGPAYHAPILDPQAEVGTFLQVLSPTESL